MLVRGHAHGPGVLADLDREVDEGGHDGDAADELAEIRQLRQVHASAPLLRALSAVALGSIPGGSPLARSGEPR